MPETADLALLLAHAEWLRALARRLVGPASADDAVQETYVAALRSPPDAARPARPWLAQVLRNTTRMARRGGARRAAREDAAALATPVTAPAPDDAIARAETVRAVTELVLALAEPYRTTLVRHYFDGDSFADIARRDGIPEATVRGRHKQALGHLRTRLDARAGGDRGAWLAALAPLAAPSPAAALGGLLVPHVLAGLALATIGTVAAWRLTAQAEPAPAPPPRPASPAAARPVAPTPDPTHDRELAGPPRHVRQLTHEQRDVIVDQISAARVRAATASAGSATVNGPGVPPRATAAPPGARALTLDQATLASAMQEAARHLRVCYLRQVRRGPGDRLEIAAHLTFTGDPDVGTVIDAHQLFDQHGKPLPASLDDCLRNALQTLELPPLAEGSQLEITYPLTFWTEPGLLESLFGR